MFCEGWVIIPEEGIWIGKIAKGFFKGVWGLFQGARIEGVFMSWNWVSNLFLIIKYKGFESRRLSICSNYSFNLLLREFQNSSFSSLEKLGDVLGIKVLNISK